MQFYYYDGSIFFFFQFNVLLIRPDKQKGSAWRELNCIQNNDE